MPLRAVRLAQGLSLRETARQADLDPSHLSRIERRAAQPTVDTLARLARVLGLRELARLLHPYLEEVNQDDTRPTRGQRSQSRPTRPPS
jgi:transcriptional regulator with XRE-family HTH domain